MSLSYISSFLAFNGFYLLSNISTLNKKLQKFDMIRIFLRPKYFQENILWINKCFLVSNTCDPNLKSWRISLPWIKNLKTWKRFKCVLLTWTEKSKNFKNSSQKFSSLTLNIFCMPIKEFNIWKKFQNFTVKWTATSENF